MTRRVTAAVGALTLVLIGALTAQPAAADTAPTDSTLPATVSSDALPTAQINGVAWDQEMAGTTVYVGGNFTRVRPAGAAAGVSETTVAHMMAYDVTTGRFTGFAPRFNAQVIELAVSPDGSRLYAAGDFTSITHNGVTTAVNRVAAFSTSTGALLTTFRPTVNARVSTVTASNTTVYLGGIFSTVNGQTRTRVAAVSASNGAVQAAIGSANAEVTALKLSPDNRQLIVGGRFTTFNGSGRPGYGLARVDTATGQSLPLPANDLIRNATSNSSITSLSGDADYFYGSGYHFGAGGNLEGTFAARWSDGTIVWVEDCHGDTHQSFPIGGVVYSASHKHYCGNIGGFQQTEPWSHYRATAVTKAVRGTVTRDPHGYFNYAGQPAPQLLNWFPSLDIGTFTGQNQGPFAVTGNSQYVVMGGEFKRVNNVPQQGLVRFAVSSIAPRKDGPRLAGAAFNPRAVSLEAGKVRITWPANWDRDNARLTYKLYRTTTTSVTATTPTIFQQTVTAPFWAAKPITYTDTVTPGSSQSYLVTATDPHGNTAKSGLVTVTAATTATDHPYATTVLADGASALWRLGEASGTTVQDWVEVTHATADAGVTRGAPGAVPGDRASTFNGTTTGFAVARTAVPAQAPNTFSVEAWFRTTSTSGGKVVGYGNKYTGGSTNYDRHVYLDNAGRVYFGVNSGGTKTVSTPGSFNDGQWHHVVGTLGSNGLRLYVDGALVGSRTDATAGQSFRGYWRIGGDTLGTSWPGTKTSGYLNGAIDDVAVYPTVLSAAQVAAHRTRASAAAQDEPTAEPQNAAPTASFTATTNELTVAVDGSGSSDPDGTLASYAWDFGDGTTGTGATATRTYAAAGTYTVRLLVTDDRGATASTTKPVTVTQTTTTPPPPPPTGEVARDAFERTVSGGWGDAEVGGTWSRSGAASSFSVAGGVGRLLLPTAGTNLTASLAGSATSTEVRTVVAVDKLATGGGTYVSVIGRQVPGAGDYRGRLRLYPSGAVVVQTARGGSAIGAVTVPGLTYAPGDRLAVRLQVTGTSPTTLRVKTWRAGTAEPAAWQVTSTDATAGLQVGGGVGLGVLLSSTSTDAPVVATFDDLWAGAPVD